MKKPVKLQDVQTATFWNDSHKLTLIFQPLDDVIEPPAEPLKIPTGIQLSVIEDVTVKPNIPTGIELTEYKI